jgi:hypothetical protein
VTRLLHTNYTRDLMALAIEALAEWAKLRGVEAPGGKVETHCMPVYQAKTETTMYLTEDETTDVRSNRIRARQEQEIRFRELGQFDWADRSRDNTDRLERGMEIQRRRGGPRDDE